MHKYKTKIANENGITLCFREATSQLSCAHWVWEWTWSVGWPVVQWQIWSLNGDFSSIRIWDADVYYTWDTRTGLGKKETVGVPSWEPVEECSLKYGSSNDDSLKMCSNRLKLKFKHRKSHSVLHVCVFVFGRIQQTWLVFNLWVLRVCVFVGFFRG